MKALSFEATRENDTRENEKKTELINKKGLDYQVSSCAAHINIVLTWSSPGKDLVVQFFGRVPYFCIYLSGIVNTQGNYKIIGQNLNSIIPRCKNKRYVMKF